MKNIIYFIFAVALFTSCNSKLSEDKARELINKRGNYPKKCALEVPGTFLEYYEDDAFAEVAHFDRIDEISKNIKKLQDLGILTYEEIDRLSERLGFMSTSKPHIIYQTELTEKGKEYLLKEEEWNGDIKQRIKQINFENETLNSTTTQYFLHVCDLEIDKITGIKQNEANAIVEYSLAITNKSPFFEITENNKYNKKILGLPYTAKDLMNVWNTDLQLDGFSEGFTKYDDGWRIVE